MAGTMKNTLISLALLTTLVSSAPTNCGGASSTGKALYFITNDDQNSVAALPIAADGTLSEGALTATGGAGSVAVNATGDPALPDALLSQSALKVAGSVSSPHLLAIPKLTSPAHLCSQRRLQHPLHALHLQC